MKGIVNTFATMLVGCLLLAGNVAAQQQPTTPTDLADAKAGECYAQVYTPPQYETSARQMLKQEAATRIETVPATYETITEKVLVKEASERLEVIPATYEKVTDQVMVKEASTRLETVPAVYETKSEQVLVQPARQVWKSSTGRIYGAAIKGDDGKMVTKINNSGDVLCLVEEPAEYKTVTKRVLKTPATTRTIEIPAEYTTMTKQVMKTQPSTRKVVIPAEYKTVTKRVLKTPATTRTIEIPAEYTTVTDRKMISEAKSEWVRVLCEVNVTASTIREVQRSLKQAGHYVGPVDGVYGNGTDKAIASYQQKKNLAQGHGLTLQTLDALAVNY